MDDAEITPGDLVMFLELICCTRCRPIRGEQRISIAFNAIPERLDNFGYAVRFA